MRILIVERQNDLSAIWQRHLERAGAVVRVAQDSERAIRVLNQDAIELLIVSLALADGTPMAIADYAAYRRPEAKVIFVTPSSFFSDGSIFQHVANAAMMLPEDTPPDDLLAVVEHCLLGPDAAPKPNGNRH